MIPYIAGIKEEARLGVKLGTWCGMPELAGLATVFGLPVRSVYPAQFHLACHPFMNTTFHPQQLVPELRHGEEQDPAVIMWSHMPSPGSSSSPNLFVPLVIPIPHGSKVRSVRLTTASRKRLSASKQFCHPFPKKTNNKICLLLWEQSNLL